MKLSAIATILGLGALANAHMELKDPAPFRSKNNPNAKEIDHDIRSPLEASGSNFPCKGYYSQDLNTDAGKPTATWSPGGSYSMTVTGNTPHNGGSCQASISTDGGSTFKVLHSFIGGCPTAGDSSWDFTLPSDTPTGKALFAWSWFNWGGNREMYMNCAPIDIVAGNKRRISERSLSSAPDMFVANVGNGVCTYEGAAVEFPNPGPNVSRSGQNTKPPGSGSCGGFGKQ